MGVRKIYDRLSGKDALAPDARCALVEWSQASSRLARVVADGSVLSASDRAVVLSAFRYLLDSPATDVPVDLDRVHDLESRLMADDLAAVVRQSEDRVARAQAIADSMNEGS